MTIIKKKINSSHERISQTNLGNCLTYFTIANQALYAFQQK